MNDSIHRTIMTLILLSCIVVPLFAPTLAKPAHLG